MRPYGPSLPTRHWPVWVRYALTVGLFAFVVALQSVWSDAADYPFLFYLCVIVICGGLFDRGSSLLATGLAAGLTGLFALRPDYAFSRFGAPDLAAWLIFTILGLISGGLVEVLHKAVDDLNRTNQRLAASEREKDLLLQETAHRTRNDFTRLIGLIRLEENNARDDPRLRDRLRGIADRVHVFSRLQNRLTRADGSAVVQMDDFIRDLCHDVHSSMAGVRPIRVEAESDAHPVPEPTAAVLGLIANELVTNALKHAFPGNRPGRVAVTFRSRDGECVLCVEDDGVGIQPRGQMAAGGHRGLGERLVQSLVGQLQGRYEARPRRDGSGTIASVRFPKAAAALEAEIP